MGSSSAYRSAVGVALAASCILVWLSLGVGIIGKDGDPANLMYFGVLVVGIIGAVIARFRPHGLARALFAMALAQALGRSRALRVAPVVSSPQMNLKEVVVNVGLHVCDGRHIGPDGGHHLGIALVTDIGWMTHT